MIDSGTPRNRFAKASHGFFGQDGESPKSMIATAREMLLAYPTVNFIHSSVIAAGHARDGFAITLGTGEKIQARKLVLAFGVHDLLPTIPGLPERWGQSVLHCPYCHGFEFAGQRLGVLNVSPLSAHQALLISDWGPVTFFLDGREELDAGLRVKLEARQVTLETSTVTGLEGDAADLSGVRLSDGRLVPTKAFYIASRLQMNSPIAEQLGCEFEEGPLGPMIRVDAGQQTSVPGVYAAGDIARAKHNATYASADGVTAGVSAHQALIFEPLANLGGK